MISKMIRIDPLLHDSLKKYTVISGTSIQAVIRDAIYTAVASYRESANWGLREAPTCPRILEPTPERFRRLKSGKLCRVDEDGLLIE